MKKALIVFLLLPLAISLSAQIKITDQPGDAYYEQVKKMCTGKTPAQKILLAMKPGPVSASILDTLRKYDWYAIGQYSTTDKEYWDNFAPALFANEKESQYQFHCFRLLADNTRADFSLNRFKTDPSNITTTSFTKGNCSVYQSIKVVKGISFIQSVVFGSNEYLKIVSYKDGVLVLDISINGRPTDPVRFRSIFYAVPKQFKWGFAD
ncbi:MAG: hypothetical protein K0S33_1599 [Bacteroidetes bacterium]|jgi:hypothetical protein|nr:hypothetical protein [Bacteroidota bacterium]